MRRFLLIAFLAGAALVSDRAFSASESELTAYASIFAMTQEAEKNCPNTYTSDAAILILKEANHVTEKDDRALKTEVNKTRAAIQREIAEQYGPKGRVKNYLITR
jgi:hypothetical protein